MLVKVQFVMEVEVDHPGDEEEAYDYVSDELEQRVCTTKDPSVNVMHIHSSLLPKGKV